MAYGKVKADSLIYDNSGSDVEVQLSALATTVSPALTGTPTAPTPTANDSSTKVATTAFVMTELSDYATLASPSLSNPTFTGNATAPTQSANDSSTKVATTAFVMTELGDYALTASPAFTTDIELSAAAPIKFMDADSSHYVAFKAAATVAANVTWTLPATDGAANTMLTTDGSGALSWTVPAAGASLGLAIALG